MMDRFPPILDIEQVIAHRGAMRLVDRVIDYDDERIAVAVDVPHDGLFHSAHGVPAWVGIEYMAQAVACWAGCMARLRGVPPPVGFLLGTRRYECTVPHFEPGLSLQIQAQREVMGDNGLGVFACRILAGDEELARAHVSVFEPPDAKAFLDGGA